MNSKNVAQFQLILLTPQCDDLWVLKEGIDVEGLQEIYDLLMEDLTDPPCPNTLKPERCFNLPDELYVYVEVLGFKGVGRFDDTGEELVLIVEWEEPVAAPKGSCIIITIPEEDEVECPEIKEITECCPDLNIALLDCNNELAGYMSFETLYNCIRKRIKLCDLLENAQRLDVPDADFDLIGVKGFNADTDKERGCDEGECDPYLINSMDMCCEPVPDVEPDCE